MKAGTRTNPHPTVRIDTGWDDGPVICFETADQTWHAHHLNASETVALIRKLAGYLAVLHPPT